MDAARLAIEDWIAEVAARQHGVVTREQLVEAGLTPGAIDGRVRTNRLRVVHRGVYRLGSLVGVLVPTRSREMAAVLACGSGSALSHESAASLWQIVPSRGHSNPVHVTIPGADRRRPGIRTHRVPRLEPECVTVLDGIPVTRPARTILDLAARTAPRALERAIARAERLGLTKAEELRARVASMSGRPGVPVLRSLLGEGAAALTRSAAEDRFLALVRRGRLPDPETNAVQGRYEIDFLWRSHGVAVEVDGFAYHGSRRTFENDRRRDAELASGGIQVLRVTWRQLVDEPDAVLVRVARTLALAEARR